MNEKQIVLLKRIIQHTVKNVEFYSWLKNRIQTTDLKCFFDNLPIVEKGYIKNHYELFISRNILDADVLSSMMHCKDNDTINILDSQYFIEFTSGSSGIPFYSIKNSAERMNLGRQLWIVRRQFYNYKPFELLDFIHCKNSILRSNINDDENSISNEIEFLKESNYKCWHISQYKLSRYYDYICEIHTSFNNLRVIENNGSYLSSAESKIYEEAFNCKVADNYGCREIWNIAYTCKYGHLHINEGSVYFELVDDDNRIITESNKIGYVVVTSLHLFSMPFIRYKNGDMAYYSDEKCSLSDSRIIKIVPGRSLIYGTEIIGNSAFKSVVLTLIKYKGLSKFHSISVRQNYPMRFDVNIKQNQEEKKVIEQAFVECTCDILKVPFDYYEYRFTYDDTLDAKSIFLSSII